MSATATRLLTVDEFARMPQPRDGSRQELVRGKVITMPPPGWGHGKSQLRPGVLLDGFVRPRRLGHVVGETGVITGRDPDSVRGPDAAYWSFERLPPDAEPETYADVAADLCVEILSPNSSLKRLMQKIREYFRCGVRMVWVIDPDSRTISVYRSPKKVRILKEGDMISGEDVIPGFECKVAEFF